MKIFFIFLTISLAAHAETNLVLTNWIFTNLQGRVYSNTTLRTATPTGITIAWAPYGSAKIDFTNLPAEVREKFHYDPEAEKQFRGQQEWTNNMLSENRKFLAKRAAAKAAAKKTERRDLAEVFQVLPDGVLVNFITGIGPIPEWYAQAAVDGKVKPDYSFNRQLAMLWQFPKTNVFDGKFLIVTSYSIGTYDYETVGKTVKTVPRFTDWLDTAEVWQNAPDSDIFKKGGADGRNFAFALPWSLNPTNLMQMLPPDK